MAWQSGRLIWRLLCLLLCVLPGEKFIVSRWWACSSRGAINNSIPFFSPTPYLFCTKFPLTLLPYNSLTLKADCLSLNLEWYLQKSTIWMNGTIHQRVYCTKPRLIDIRTLHRLCKIREATTWEWMNGSCVLNGWLTTPTPFSKVLANILGTASVKHHYANG